LSAKDRLRWNAILDAKFPEVREKTEEEKERAINGKCDTANNSGTLKN
jgi:hypothetical protein